MYSFSLERRTVRWVLVTFYRESGSVGFVCFVVVLLLFCIFDVLFFKMTLQ